jgi:hypothetical protein
MYGKEAKGYTKYTVGSNMGRVGCLSRWYPGLNFLRRTGVQFGGHRYDCRKRVASTVLYVQLELCSFQDGRVEDQQ